MKASLPTLLNDIPIDKTALKVILPSKFKFELPKGQKIYDVCPEIDKIRHYMYSDPNFTDYTGFKYGRFEVLGMLKNRPKKFILRISVKDENVKAIKKERCNTCLCRWVVRCSCGLYEVRKAKALKKADRFDRCCLCQNKLRLWKKDFIARHGRVPTTTELEKWI